MHQDRLGTRWLKRSVKGPGVLGSHQLDTEQCAFVAEDQQLGGLHDDRNWQHDEEDDPSSLFSLSEVQMECCIQEEGERAGTAKLKKRWLRRVSSTCRSI